MYYNIINYNNKEKQIFSGDKPYIELFNNNKILSLNGPIIITKNEKILDYDFSTIIKQLPANNTIKLFTLPDPINSSIKDKCINLIYNDIISNDTAIALYKTLIKYNYDLNFKGIFLDDFIGFSDIEAYKNFSKYVYQYKELENFSILYTYIINSFYKPQEVIPMSIKLIDKNYYFNNAIFYNDIEKLIY